MKPAQFLIVVALLAASWVFTLNFYDTAFPELSLDYALEKQDVVPASDRQLRSLDLDPGEYHRVVTFNERSLVKYYLELTYGLEALIRDIRAGISISGWRTRYFLPGEQEEFSVNLDTEGRLTGFRHILPETRKLQDAGSETAFRLATDFLATQLPRHPLASLEASEKSEKKRTGHTVYSFTWERADWRRGDARYHLHVDVSGSKITRYHEHLDIPEDWRRQYARDRNANKTLQNVAEAIIIILLAGCLAWFVVLIIRHEIHWHGFPLYWIIPVGLLLLAAQISNFPGILNNYQTQNDFNNYIVSSSLQSFYSVVMQIIQFFVLAFVADSFWQRQFPQHTPIRSLLNGRGLATRESHRAVVIGFVLASLTMAYVVGYYAAGKQFGIWVPSNIDYSKVLTSYFPAIEALSGGFGASWREEFIFRVMTILFIARFTGSKWLAIIVSAAVWGFLHSNYPQMPGYARGIELTIEGILLGWVALRFGILTTLLSHCLYNTWLGAAIAWQTGSLLHMSMALVVSLWPIGLWIKGQIDARRAGRYLEPRDLQPDSTPIRQQIMESKAILAVTPICYPKSVYAGLLLLMTSFAVIYYYLPASPDAPQGHITLNKRQIATIADRALHEETRQEAATYKRLITHHEEIPKQSLDYLLEHASVQELAGYINKYLYANYWRVRYFRPGERDTYTVYIDQGGKRLLVNRSLSENTRGAELDIDAAIALAAGFLGNHISLASDKISYVSHVMKKHPSRKDYTVTFRLNDWNIGDSELRWNVLILGDKFNGLNQYVKLPEAYLRKISVTDWRNTIQRFVAFLSLLTIAVTLLAINILLIIKQYVPWRLCFRISAVVPAILLVQYFNTFPEFYAGYKTTQTLLQFSFLKLLDILLELGLSYIYTVLLCAVLLGLIRWATGRESHLILLPSSGDEFAAWYSRGLFFGIGGLCLIWGILSVSQYMYFYLSDENALETMFTQISGFIPALHGITNSMSEAIIKSLHSGIIVLMTILLWKEHRRFVIILALLLLISFNIEWRGLDETMYALSFQIVYFSVTLWLFIRLFRFNPVAYLTFYYYMLLVPGTLALSLNAWPAYQGNIILLWLMLCLPVIVLVPILYRQKRSGVQA